jgi:hypothetical protein
MPFSFSSDGLTLNKLYVTADSRTTIPFQTHQIRPFYYLICRFILLV